MDVLAGVFGAGVVVPLHEYVAALRALDAPDLLQPGDGARFRRFISGTRVARCAAPGDPPHTVRRLGQFAVGSSLRQIVEQVEQHFHARQSHAVARAARPADAAWTFHTIRTHVLNPDWELLLVRGGDDLVRQLLISCSVFEPLAHGCYLQVSGRLLSTIPKIKSGTATTLPLQRYAVECVTMLYARCKSRPAFVGRGGLEETPGRRFVVRVFAVKSGRRWNRSQRYLVPLCRRLIQNHSRLNYRRLLNSFCALPDMGAASDPRWLLQRHCPPAQVAAFLRHVVLRVIPPALLGSKRNFAGVCRAIHGLVGMRRYDAIDLHHFARGFKSSDCPWIFPNGGPSAAVANQTMILRWLRWLYAGFLVPVLRTFFYATESEPYRNRVLYYRHEVWERIQRLTFDRLSGDQFERIAARKNLVGVSRLRLLPKLGSVRPLINCSYEPASIDAKKPISINKRLRPCLLALEFETGNDRNSFGSGAPNHDVIHERLRPFIAHLRQAFDGAPPQVYIVAADFAKCFDKIQRPKLMEIIAEQLRHSDYFTYRWASIVQGHHKAYARYHRAAFSAADLPQFDEFAGERARLCRNAILIEQQAGGERISRDNVLELINDHISRNLIEGHDGAVYRQTCGIPQGSIVSALLCSLYLADLERRYLRSLIGFRDRDWVWTDSGSAGMLLRQVDDFLLLTTSKACADAFVGAMLAGFPDYNCHVNAAKTRANFPVANAAVSVQDVIPWCGIQFDSRNVLALLGDYTRFSHLPTIADTLSVRLTIGQQCQRLRQRFLRAFVRFKTHPLMLDSSINPRHIVALNVYQIFRFASLKCYAYLRALRAFVNSDFVCNVFIDLLVVFHQIRKRRCTNCAFDLDLFEVKWLALKAFKAVFQRRQTRFRKVMEWIDKALGEPRMKQHNRCRDLRFAVRDEENRDLLNILY